MNTIPATLPQDKCKVIIAQTEESNYTENNKILKVGMLGEKGYAQTRKVYSEYGLSPTIDTMQGGNRQPKIMVELPCVAASRGRNPENPSSRVSGLPTEQRLEINHNGTSNTLTTVQKGNYVLEPTQSSQNENTNKLDIIGNYSPSNYESSKIVNSECISPTVKGNHGTVTATNLSDFRIRKLTPTECWRLMGFRDEHIQRAMNLGVSDSQLYKQAGNSIVVDVLYYIFKELFKDNIVR